MRQGACRLVNAMQQTHVAFFSLLQNQANYFFNYFFLRSFFAIGCEGRHNPSKHDSRLLVGYTARLSDNKSSRLRK
jgi:hypothetical protein